MNLLDGLIGLGIMSAMAAATIDFGTEVELKINSYQQTQNENIQKARSMGFIKQPLQQQVEMVSEVDDE